MSDCNDSQKAVRPVGCALSGFTLIELLVTIAVVAILASLLLSALAPAKTQAQRTYCQNNLHQLGLALTMYGDENGQYPQAFDPPFPIPNLNYVLSWNMQLLPFVQNDADVFNCPSYPDSFRWDSKPSVTGNLFPANILALHQFCYGFNEIGVAGNGEISPITILGLEEPGNTQMLTISRKPSQILAPADMIAIGDEPVAPTNYLYPVPGISNLVWGIFLFHRYSLASNYPIVGSIHEQGANMLCVDGHVEWARWWKWTAQTDTAARRWNYDDQPHEEDW